MFWLIHFTHTKTGDFLGAVITEAQDITAAIRKSAENGTNPGGHVTFWPVVREDLIPIGCVDRRLDQREAALIQAPVGAPN